jgi:hypothetical protein
MLTKLINSSPHKQEVLERPLRDQSKIQTSENSWLKKPVAVTVENGAEDKWVRVERIVLFQAARIQIQVAGHVSDQHSDTD